MPQRLLIMLCTSSKLALVHIALDQLLILLPVYRLKLHHLQMPCAVVPRTPGDPMTGSLADLRAMPPIYHPKS